MQAAGAGGGVEAAVRAHHGTDGADGGPLHDGVEGGLEVAVAAFGAVLTAIGAILFYALAFGFMTRLVRLARESNATSLADLAAASGTSMTGDSK